MFVKVSDLKFWKICDFPASEVTLFVLLEFHPQLMSVRRNFTAEMLSPIGTIKIEHGSVAAYKTNELWSISKLTSRLLCRGRVSSHCEPVYPSSSFVFYLIYVRKHIDVSEINGTAISRA